MGVQDQTDDVVHATKPRREQVDTLTNGPCPLTHRSYGTIDIHKRILNDDNDGGGGERDSRYCLQVVLVVFTGRLSRLRLYLRRHPRYAFITNSLRSLRDYLTGFLFQDNSNLTAENSPSILSTGGEFTMPAFSARTRPLRPDFYSNLEELDACESRGKSLEGVISYTPRSAAVEKVYKSKGKLLVSDHGPRHILSILTA